MSDHEDFPPEDGTSNEALVFKAAGLTLNDGAQGCSSYQVGDEVNVGEPKPEEKKVTSSQHTPLAILDGKFFKILTSKCTGDNVVAVCRKCEPDLVEVKGHRLSTSNFVSHLKRKHGNDIFAEYKEYLTEKKYKTGEGENTSDGIGAKKLKSSVKRLNISQQIFEDKISWFIIHSMVPFHVVEDKYFKDLMQSVGISILGLTIPSRRTVVRRVENLFENNNSKLRDLLKDIPFVCTTADIWSGKKRSFLGVTVHWINLNYERKSGVLACRRFKNSHTYDKIAALLQDIHSEFGLSVKKITATVTDNGANFIKAFKKFGVDTNIIQSESPDTFLDDVDFTGQCENSSESDEDLSDIGDDCLPPNTFSAKQFSQELRLYLPNHMRCASHTLHLCASSDIKKGYSKHKSLEELHNQVLEKCNILWNFAGRPKTAEILQDVLSHTLSRPGDTRWNSLYDSLQQILKCANKFPQLYRQLKAKQKLHDQDFVYITEYLECSEPLAYVLNILQGEEKVFYGALLPLLLALQRKLEELQQRSWQFCAPLIKIYLTSLEKRFSDFFDFESQTSQSAATAAFANPLFKKRWLRSVDSTHHEKLIGCFKSAVMAEIQETASSSKTSTHLESKTPQYLEFLDLEDDEDCLVENKKEAIADLQVCNYFIDPSREFNSLENYPAVRNVFLRSNTPLPSSAPVERLFSFATMTNTAKANRLSDKNFEMRVVLKANSFSH